MESERNHEPQGAMDEQSEGPFCGTPSAERSSSRSEEAPSIVFIGVQHTGTKFFVSLLENHYGPYTPLKTPRGRFYYDHPWPHKLPLIRSRMRGRLLVTTERDKESVRRSWVDRGIHEMDDFQGQWEAWERFILPRADVVVSVDRDRERRLNKLSEVLGIELQTDWQPVNATRRRGSGV